LTQPPRLDGRVGIITGAGSSGPGFGTGKAISVLFAREGASVVLVDKYEERARETLGLIEDEGGTGAIVTADLTEPSAYERIVARAVGRFGTLDILVNNAAIASPVGILETSPELYHDILALNLTAPFMMSRAVIPIMVKGGGGAIVNISSIAAMRGVGVSQPAYAASKAGLMGLTTDLADAFGTRGIRVNCIAPGIIDTPMRAAFAAQLGAELGKENAGERTALGREGDAWDIARAALFLVSDEASFITGLLLPVDGGTTARSH
jgi:NAD(P)-dependent dehydrogenase (short-subunit alcohol dehydrogenase family)